MPTNLKGVRGFLVLSGYYRKFIRGYAMIASPLTDLLRKDAFHWSLEAEQAFKVLQSAITTAPVLQLPNFNKIFILETDASGFGIGYVLLQDQHSIAFYGHKLSKRLQQASVYVRELHAITSAVGKWRQYLLGSRFIIRTDQKNSGSS